MTKTQTLSGNATAVLEHATSFAENDTLVTRSPGLAAVAAAVGLQEEEVREAIIELAEANLLAPHPSEDGSSPRRFLLLKPGSAGELRERAKAYAAYQRALRARVARAALVRALVDNAKSASVAADFLASAAPDHPDRLAQANIERQEGDLAEALAEVVKLTAQLQKAAHA
jgi:hypothetical protein